MNNTQVKIFPVANEFIVGDSRGLNFALSAEHPQNQQAFSALNLQAMAAADELGLIDCVVSDYEYVSAQYARSRKIKQITIDQQSKFFLPGFPKNIDGLAYLDEVQRLQMFFPDAYQRIALSFFKPQESEQHAETPVTLLPPILRPEILNAKGLTRFSKRTIMIYMSSMYQLDLDAIQLFTSMQLHTNFIVFLPPEHDLPADVGNVKFMAYADFDFMLILSRCHGIITAAGHSLLAEAMYLGIPVLAVPAHIYEQQLNAKVIGDNGFGINCKGDLTAEILNHFLLQLDQFRSNIESDRGKILLLGTDASNLINIIKGVAEHMEVSHHDYRTRSGSTSSISRIGRRII